MLSKIEFPLTKHKWLLSICDIIEVLLLTLKCNISYASAHTQNRCHSGIFWGVQSLQMCQLTSVAKTGQQETYILSESCLSPRDVSPGWGCFVAHATIPKILKNVSCVTTCLCMCTVYFVYCDINIAPEIFPLCRLHFFFKLFFASMSIEWKQQLETLKTVVGVS